MGLTDWSDSEILAHATPMIDDIVRGANARDWAMFSKYQTPDDASDPENRASVERQWQAHAFLTTLALDRTILGILRRDDAVQLVWVQHSTAVPGDFLARLYLREIDGRICETAFLIQ